MIKQTWESYWESTGRSFLERQVQRYKEKIGYQRLLYSVPEIGINGRVLEVGAGKAWMSRLLLARGWHTIAIDLNSDIAMSSSTFVDTYVIGDIFNLPFKENSFDLVVSCGLLEHFNKVELTKTTAEMRRTGRSVVAWLPTCGMEWRILWAIRNLFGGNIDVRSNRYREKDLREIFFSQGFKHVRVGFILFAGLFRYIYVYGSDFTPLENHSKL
jgi:SAM-dependent methyltransferase